MKIKMIVFSLLFFLAVMVSGCGMFGGKTNKKCIPCQSSQLSIFSEYQIAARMP